MHVQLYLYCMLKIQLAIKKMNLLNMEPTVYEIEDLITSVNVNIYMYTLDLCWHN